MIACSAIGEPVIAQDLIQDEDAEIEQMIVTGSRIKRSGLTAPTPVTVLDSEALSLQGEVNIATLLNQLPALGSTFTNASSSGFIGTVGLSFLDLRRLGQERTLVLVDGRRHIGSSAGTASVDINSIPQELVDRVEVVTGGASAIYGADAVTGVVNFVMKDDFEGVSLYAQAGQADEGDAFSYTVRGLVGGNFADGKGNAVVSFEWADSNGFIGNDRSFDRANLTFVENPADGDTSDNTNDGIPDTILVGDARLNFITIPGIFLDSTGFIDPVGNGFQIIDGAVDLFTPGNPVFANDGVEVGGDGLPLSDISGSLNADLQRLITTARVTYEIHPLLNAFVEMKYVNSTSFALNGTGAFDIFSLGINADNAFLPDEIRQAFIDNGVALDDTQVFSVSRSHNEAERAERAERVLFRGVVGLEGEFDNGIGYELSYVYGRTTSQIQQFNNRINDRFFAGVDAVIDTDTGNPICRVTQQVANGEDPTLPDGSPAPGFVVDGCVPINLFGAGAISDEAIDFAYANGFVNETLEQSVVTLSFTGDSTAANFELPAGPIGWAVGAEYRDEDAESFPTEIDQLGLTFLNVIPPTTGGFDVYEVFGEVTVPIVKDLPFAEEISVDAAVRFADYSTVGSTTSWKVGGNWTPTSDLRFRSTFSRAIRAPNISELFGPQSQTFLFFDDPCDVDFLDQGSPTRAANCAALGAPPGFQQDNTVGNTPGTTGGNPDLNEETADSLTIGAVWTPSYVPGLSVTVDFWDIDIEDSISVATLDDVLSNCVDAPTIDNQFCPLLTRDPATFQLVTFQITNQNFAAAEARGIDFEVNYELDLADVGLDDYGSLDFRVIGTHVLRRNDFPFQESPDVVDEEEGELGDPEWAVTYNMTWRWDRFSFNYEMRFLSKQVIVEVDDLVSDPDLQFPFETDRTFFHDIQARYQINEYVEVFGGINNISQEFPPFGLSGAGTDSAIFDNIGRFYYGGFRANF